MDMLCIAAEADPTGYVLINRTTPTVTDLARLTGAPEAEVETLLAELERNGVFSRDGKCRIYSRRMLRDLKKSKANQKNGKKGGDASVEKQKGIFQSPKPSLGLTPANGAGPYKPIAINQNPPKPQQLENGKGDGEINNVLYAFYEIRRLVWGSPAKLDYSPKEISIAQGWLKLTGGESEPIRALFETQMRKMSGRGDAPPGTPWFFHKSIDDAAASGWAGYGR